MLPTNHSFTNHAHTHTHTHTRTRTHTHTHTHTHTYTGCLKIYVPHWFHCIKSSFILVLKSNHITSYRSNQMTRTEIGWLYPTVHVKDKVLRNVLGGIFSESFRQNLSLHPHCQVILQSTSSQIWDFFFLLVEVVYWPSGLKCVYPTINLAFLGIIVQVKLPAKFCLNNFEWFCLLISSVTKSFSSLVQGIVMRNNSFYCILFSNLNQKRTQHYH